MLIDTILILTLTFLLLTLYLLPKSKKNKKHLNNINRGEELIKKIHKFNFEGQRLNYLRKVDPFVFEEILLSSFKHKGYTVKRNVKYTGDGGFDGVLFDNNSNMILIQAKRYKSYINPQHIQIFEKLVLSKNAYRGYFIHTGKTGKKTYATYNSNFEKRIEIISGAKLLELIDNN